jgi:hypothetical protein
MMTTGLFVRIIKGRSRRCAATPSSSAAASPPVTERLALLIEHDAEVRRRIAALRAEQAHLQEKIGWYRSQLTADDASDPVL